MPLLESLPPQLGKRMPAFALPDVYGHRIADCDFTDKPVLVVMFICAHCPYVLAVESRFVALARTYAHKGVQFIGICSNDAQAYPADAPEQLRARAETQGYSFPYLVDASQEIARAFGAVCTPEFYVYDSERKLCYHGRLDDNWKEADAVTRHELASAIDSILLGKAVTEPQHPSIGCSIKWKV
jgi:peroxiredoxin